MAKRQPYGTTWWGRRFVETLESFGWADRLQRGRTYARQGRVFGLTVGTGGAEAKVEGSLAKPYKVRIHFAPLRPADWTRATQTLAQRPELVAGLLSGVLTPDLEGALEAVGAQLFPADQQDLETSCSCPDWASPCKHVAAVYYTLAEALDSDPLLLVELRGRSREALVRDLTERWNAEGYTFASETAEQPPKGQEAGPHATSDAFWTAGPAAASLLFRLEPVPESGALLDRLEIPPELTGSRAVLSRLKHYYQRIHLQLHELDRRRMGTE